MSPSRSPRLDGLILVINATGRRERATLSGPGFFAIVGERLVRLFPVSRLGSGLQETINS
jgi:hypothetical protein